MMEQHLSSVGALVPATVHDVRNPINVIKTSVYFLQSKLAEVDPRLLRHLELINRSCQSAALVMDDLLLYARPRGAAFSSQPILPVVQRAIEALGEDAARVSFQPDGELPPVAIDPGFIALAVRKMLQAALLRSPGEGSVELFIRRAADGIDIVVEDHGAAVSEAQREAMFLPLVSDEGVRSTNLAAALITEIARIHGGSARCETLADQGNRVVFHLGGPAIPPRP
ncbi:MAG: hypothetical protein LC772_07040 [Chloroflexi bacterium]|nr:hypothetical protein [Chloroflexota bacterium]